MGRGWPAAPLCLPAGASSAVWLPSGLWQRSRLLFSSWPAWSPLRRGVVLRLPGVSSPYSCILVSGRVSALPDFRGGYLFLCSCVSRIISCLCSCLMFPACVPVALRRSPVMREWGGACLSHASSAVVVCPCYVCTHSSFTGCGVVSAPVPVWGLRPRIGAFSPLARSRTTAGRPVTGRRAHNRPCRHVVVL